MLLFFFLPPSFIQVYVVSSTGRGFTGFPFGLNGERTIMDKNDKYLRF